MDGRQAKQHERPAHAGLFLSGLLGLMALPINFIIYVVGFMVMFHLDGSELLQFTVTFLILNVLFMVALRVLLA